MKSFLAFYPHLLLLKWNWIISSPTPLINVVPLFKLPLINNKQPSFEWTGGGRGPDCFDLWRQCLNMFVVDCNHNGPWGFGHVLDWVWPGLSKLAYSWLMLSIPLTLWYLSLAAAWVLSTTTQECSVIVTWRDFTPFKLCDYINSFPRLSDFTDCFVKHSKYSIKLTT